MADAVEAVRQDVGQNSADELGGNECHDLLAITTFGAIILPSEGDAVAVGGNQSAVGDGDTVGEPGDSSVSSQRQFADVDHARRCLDRNFEMVCL